MPKKPSEPRVAVRPLVADCNPRTSSHSWIDPKGKVHLVPLMHDVWAEEKIRATPSMLRSFVKRYREYYPDELYEFTQPWSGFLVDHGWVRVANFLNFEGNHRTSRHAWESAADLIIDCVIKTRLDPETTVVTVAGYGKQRFSVSQIVREWGGSKAEDRLFSGLLARTASTKLAGRTREPLMKPSPTRVVAQFDPSQDLGEWDSTKVRYKAKADSSGILVAVYYGRKRIGGISAYTKRYPENNDTLCDDDVRALVDRHPHLVTREWERGDGTIWRQIPTLSVDKASLDDAYHGKGIGKAMYAALMREWFKKEGPFVFIPYYCTIGSGTSPMAKRVWDSLARRFPSVGHAVAVLKPPKIASASRRSSSVKVAFAWLKQSKNLPKNVERYVQEGKDQGLDEGEAWAVAWSRYCKWKEPGSPHCKKNSPKDYLQNQGKKQASHLPSTRTRSAARPIPLDKGYLRSVAKRVVAETFKTLAKEHKGRSTAKQYKRLKSYRKGYGLHFEVSVPLAIDRVVKRGKGIVSPDKPIKIPLWVTTTESKGGGRNKLVGGGTWLSIPDLKHHDVSIKLYDHTTSANLEAGPFEAEVFDALIHEATHIVDLYTRERESSKGYNEDHTKLVDPTAYVNDPKEVRAFMQQIADQIVQDIEGGSPSVAVSLYSNKLWQRLRSDLTDRNRKLILKGVYTAVQDSGLDPGSNQGTFKGLGQPDLDLEAWLAGDDPLSHRVAARQFLALPALQRKVARPIPTRVAMRWASENEPTNPKLWAKVQALAKGEQASMTLGGKTVNGPNEGEGFEVFPSAYANGWASKTYKDLGGGWKKKARGKAEKDVGHGGLDEWFSGHGGAKGKGEDATWGDWVSISPVTKTLPSGKKVEKGDIVGECGISDDPDWKGITKGGKDPLKCMPRQKAHDMPKKERAEKAKAKQKAERADSSRGKKPTMTPTFDKKADRVQRIQKYGSRAMVERMYEQLLALPALQRKVAARHLEGFVTNDIAYLMKYLKLKDDEKGGELAYGYPYEFAEWIHDNYGGGDSGDALVDQMVAEFVDGDSVLDYDIWDINPSFLSEWYNSKEWLWALHSDMATAPAWFSMSNPELVKNQWLVHFTDDADSIACEGFTHGIGDMQQLGYTTSFTMAAKSGGGYNFAYTLDDWERYARGRYGFKYGKEAVMFKASGVKIWHSGDNEPQVIFVGNTAKDIVPFTEYSGDWYANNIGKGGREEGDGGDEGGGFDSLSDAVDWVSANYNQYKKLLVC